MTRDTYDVTIRRPSQVSHKLELFRTSSPGMRRPSKVSSMMAKRTLLREDFRGSDRTLVSSSLDSNTSSRSNVHTFASSSYCSNTDIRCDDRTDDEDDEDKPEELETDKGRWERTLHYVIVGFGLVFGIRNILKFPSLAVEHGGGAFVFTYIFLTFTCGVPIVYLEVSLGQYARGGVIKAWRIIPLTKGIAVSSLALTLARLTYSSTPAAWAVYYLFAALSGKLPFRHLDLKGQHKDMTSLANLTTNETRLDEVLMHQAAFNKFNQTFYALTLEVTDSISNMGHVVPHVIICLMLVWLAVFVLSALGPRLLGKIALLLTAVPAVLILVALVGSCSMSGAVLGIQAFLSPKWYHLASFKPWLDAFDLVLSSLACGTGVLVTLSGHCCFHGNTFRNAMLMTVASLVMTLVSGCLLLSLLGAESKLSDIRLDHLPKFSDVDLGFVVFPSVTSHLPAPRLWSILFFLAMALLAILQAATLLHHLQQGVLEMANLQEVKLQWKLAILGAIAILAMSFNVLTTAENGLYVLRLLQFSVPRLSTPLISVAECLTVGWGYGARRFAGRITEMTGRNKSFIWKWLWRWGCPVVLSVVSVAAILTTNLLEDLPACDLDQSWISALAWSLSAAILLPALLITAVSLARTPGTFKQRLHQLRTTPTSWGPGHPEHEPQADLPDYVICQPDPFRPANALAMLTANLYLPNIVNFVNMQPPGTETEVLQDSVSDMADLSSSDDENSIDSPSHRDSCLGRCHATIPCLSHVIGLGNIVRFPYLAYQHGGGAFIIAYVIILASLGVPLVIIEIAIGQFSSLGPVHVWRAVPIFKGVGYSMVAVSLATTVYYSVVTSWSVFYLATSLTSVMPWKGCENTWNTNSCTPHPSCQSSESTMTDDRTNRRCDVTHPECLRVNDSLCQDATLNFTNISSRSTEEYFYLSVVKVSDGWHQAGELRWQLCLCLLVTWCVILLCLIKGFRPGGKTTYCFMTLTCLTLLILLVRCSSLMGGHDGLSYLFTLQWSKLMEGQVWQDAASQVFLSMSLGCGSLVAMGTYNKFSNNVIREAALLGVIDTAISLLCSLVVFAVVGTISHSTGSGLDTAAKPDIGLTFVTLSRATLVLPWPLVWAILSFLVLVSAGVITCVSAMSTAVTSLMDMLTGPMKKHRKWLIVCVCALELVLALPMTLQIGFHVIDFLDTHLSGLPQLCVGAATLAAFAWVYGIGRLCADVSRMVDAPIGWWWRLIWAVVCPSILSMLLVSSLISVISADEHAGHPWWLKILGLVLWFMLLVPVFVGVGHETSRHTTSASLLEKLRRSCQPRKEWGATLHRCSSVVEYYPTVHTHLGLDLSRDGLNTVADHVDFTSVSVPSLSQTTLLPVSPGTPRCKRPMDMRHKAILNHAYSNPQCHLSSGSLERLGKKKRHSMVLANEELHDVILARKSKHKQPIVHVTKKIPAMARSASWHHLPHRAAILRVSSQHVNPHKMTSHKPHDTIAQRRRRYGQSAAPNLRLLITEDGEDEAGSPAHVTRPSACAVYPSEMTSLLNINGRQLTSTDVIPAARILVTSQSQHQIPRCPRLQRSGSTSSGGRSKSVEEPPVSARQKLVAGTDNVSCTRLDWSEPAKLGRVKPEVARTKPEVTRTKSDSDYVSMMRVVRKGSLSRSAYMVLPNKGHHRSKSVSGRGSCIILEEEPEVDEVRDDFRACLQMIHGETEMSKL
ncbi:uncharacterized protein LOC131944555 isoform X2 [Physella acuta]|uniref:uncharacterized protein LOC131944555 isoform X2 n=1 Tax=Physella acuta TaxID=109671 RepID=UPI0027DB2F86|nr:uncharacterized protein LOC131944555 isoform X2 [Physella acuta]